MPQCGSNYDSGRKTSQSGWKHASTSPGFFGPPPCPVSTAAIFNVSPCCRRHVAFWCSFW
ncbi:hypothetical protein MASR1M12_07790 [Erysipelotrichia bacterium]